jgi:hypothetical protein
VEHLAAVEPHVAAEHLAAAELLGHLHRHLARVPPGLLLGQARQVWEVPVPRRAVRTSVSLRHVLTSAGRHHHRRSAVPVEGWHRRRDHRRGPASARGRTSRHRRRAAREQVVPGSPRVLAPGPTRACRISVIDRDPGAFRALAIDRASAIDQRWRIVPAHPVRVPMVVIVRTSAVVPALAVNLAGAAARHRVTWGTF